MATKTSTEIPERNPVHPDALNLDDIRRLRGKKISRRYNKDDVNRHDGVIIGEPFERAGMMWVMVQAKNYKGLVVEKEWNLCDAGVVPYTGQRGSFWSMSSYTLAVED